MNLTFKQFVSMVNEDVSQEIAKIQTDISMIDAAIQQRTQPLVQRKTQLNKMLALKMKQQENEQKNNPQEPQASAQTQQQPQASKTTAPGSTGSQTPGSGAAA